MITFGVLGAAKITPESLVKPVAESSGAQIRCVAARNRTRAEEFSRTHAIPVVFDDYIDVINDDAINAVYNPLPISAHLEWTIKALHAGKHVLCEKSFALNAREAKEMAAVGQETGLVLMDAFHYRYHPIFKRAREIYLSGILGAIQSVDALFHVKGPVPADDIRMIYETGGGVTMDIGCYPVSWVRHITGAEPEVIDAEVETGPADVDTYLKATMTLPGGITATTSGDMRSSSKFEAYLKVTGNKGTMMVNNPLVPQFGNSIELSIAGVESTETFSRRATYAYQLDAFIAAIEKGESLYTDAQDAVKQMRVIDRCYEAAGLPRRGERQ